MSYVTTNLSGVRFLYGQNDGDSSNNNKLGVISRSKEERIEDNKAWTSWEIENFIRYESDVGQERYGKTKLSIRI